MLRQGNGEKVKRGQRSHGEFSAENSPHLTYILDMRSAERPCDRRVLPVLLVRCAIQAVWSFSSQQDTLRRLNRSFDAARNVLRAGLALHTQAA